MKRLFIIIIPILFLSCSGGSKDFSVVDGILDLRSGTAFEDGLIEIKGDFAFFWNEFASEENLAGLTVDAADDYMHVPGYWSPYVRGYGAYSLRILLPEQRPDVLYFKLTNVLENYSMYVNGEPVFQMGTPGTKRESSVRESAPAIIVVDAGPDILDIVFQVSVWNDVQGGLCRNIYIGNRKDVVSARERGLILDALIIGAVLLIGLYHIALFILQRFEYRYLSMLFLGMVFVLIVLFIGSKDELMFRTLFECFNASIRSKFIYSSLTISVPFFFCYIYFIFPEYMSKKVFYIVLAVSSVAWIFILSSDAAVYTKLLIPLEVFNLGTSIYIISNLFYRFAGKKTPIILGFLGGYILLVCGVVFSMLDNFMIVPVWSPGVVFLLFTVYQTVLQAFSTSDAYRQVVRLNDAFIEMEKETEKLYDLSYVDQLTSLANRRFLNEYMQKLWERNSMTGTEIGFIIVDIDYFKRYNDRYGHLAGDNCLISVAGSLRDSMNRKGDFIARYGGEEFVAIIPNCPGEELPMIAERLRENVEKMEIEHLDSDCSEFVTVSAGVSSIIPDRKDSWLRLFKKADDALYQAKKSGRNRIVSV